ncbi:MULTISPECIES: arginine deiminase [Atopobiaceae]|uniref:Arginine deiminase n=1 Tax=Parafannyhessea umbonata TaxID=604330 RepID=A0A1H9NVT3_9ACTN|nr:MULTISPECIES: arginine deiminase [Atopobiaceae]SEH58608.1 arginine deiminase [Parafannyhessea umbonata]SER39981.1 arginine deiminase [Parafannyhessea umbonata]SJZ52114.1 arginine deiminase [Olsenella sp. KH1P3]
MANGLYVHSEIGPLQKVCLHRPGEELLNLTPDDLERLLFDDIPFLEVAQAEHDKFAELLRGEGVEVLYLEKLVAEALDAAGTREEFTNQWLDESGLRGHSTRAAVKEFMDSIEDTQAFVEKCIAGIRKNEIDLPHSNGSLSAIVDDQDAVTDLLIDPMPNTYFTRDPFAIVGKGVNLNHMYSVTRNRETIFGKYIFRDHPEYNDAPLWYRRDSAYHTEGGDVLNLNAHTLAIGISQRTQASAIDTLARNMFWGDKGSEIDTIYAFNIPASRAFMHLDTVFTQIDVDKFTIHPGIMGTLQVFKITKGATDGELSIEEMNDTLEHILAKALGLDAVKLIKCGAGDPVAAAREQWNDGSNTLCVAPGKICVYQRNTVTNDVLYKEGLDLLVVPSAELSRGRGGPRCMSMPFARADI